MAKYDTLVIGPISLDHNIDYQNNEEREVGGAIVQSGFAATNSGAKTALFMKLNPEDVEPTSIFAGTDADVFWKPSAQTTQIRNQYFTADKERRECRNMGKCDPFLAEEFPAVETSIYHFAGLTYGDFDGELFRLFKTKGKIAVDVQCLLRHVEADGSMRFHDWADKKTYLPDIDFLKTDAAEAEILTGLADRELAAMQLYAWGAKEIMITHNTEVMVYDGKKAYTCPIKARSLVGRSGRGDTTFAGYITERLHADIPQSLLYASALVSLKMETPGPFRGTRDDVLAYISAFYQ